MAAVTMHHFSGLAAPFVRSKGTVSGGVFICIISNYLWQFPLSFSFFPPLFRTLISMCYAAVCGVSCGQKRSPPFAGNGFPAWTGSIFRASNCLHCNSEGRIQQVISAPSRTQKLGGCKQKSLIFMCTGPKSSLSQKHWSTVF